MLRRRIERLPQRALKALFHAGLVNDLIWRDRFFHSSRDMPDETDPQPPWLAPEPDSPRGDAFRQTAEALGFLTMFWGHLEGKINSIVIKLLKTRNLHYQIVGHIGFREKLQIIKSVAFTSTDYVSPTPTENIEWFDKLEDIINFIDNELRPNRNRMIHDMWIGKSASDALIRFGFAPKLKRSQPRQRTLERDIVPVPAAEIWTFCIRVQRARKDLADLISKIPRRA
jgi:hypothetical protein